MKTIFFLSLALISISSFAQNASISKGNRLFTMGQYGQAEIQYRKALEADATNEMALHNLADALHMQGKYEDAAKTNATLAKTTKDKMMKSAAFYNQGVAYTKLNNLESSIESYKNSLKLNPADTQARENLEKALLQLKHKQQQSQDKQKQNSGGGMSQKEADQRLKQLQQREKELQQKMNEKSQGGGQAQDW